MPAGSHPHDVAPAADGGIWFTAQAAGYLGWLDPSTGEIRQIALGAHSAPHGVIVGPDGAAWVTDGGQNAIVRVDPQTSEVRVFPIGGRNANLNTATFDGTGSLWFTGQNGVYGRLDPRTGEVGVFDAPRGPGPYGIIGAADGARVFYVSLAGSHIAEINLETALATPIDPPTQAQGARRVWADSHGSIWVSEWNAGQVGRYDPRTGEWREWKLPGTRPTAYAVWVDPQDIVWLSDWSSNAIVSFDPASETFQQFALPQNGSEVRELQGRAGEVWGAESAQDRIVVIRH
ncbi:MAG: SMP-30/gluconolactonase/LRE family protein [Chloroflexota bacterium]|nr:SMP-30/gluconolactonase/LRE family protein [Chloroflexota bacterium]